MCKEKMSGEISQITAPLSGNSKDFYRWLQFCQLSLWPWQCPFRILTQIGELTFLSKNILRHGTNDIKIVQCVHSHWASFIYSCRVTIRQQTLVYSREKL